MYPDADCNEIQRGSYSSPEPPRKIKNIYDDFRKELELNSRYSPNIFLGENDKKEYSFTRAVLESISGGSHKFLSQGLLEKSQLPTKAEPLKEINDKRIFEGWKHEQQLS